MSGAQSSTPGTMQRGQTQRVALVCDWLTTPGGAEKVLLELHRLYPRAPIYTSQYRKKGIDWFNDATVKTGWLNLFPAFLRKFLGPLRQIYFSHLDLTDYDLVISVTGAEAKSVKTKKRPAKQTLSPNYSTPRNKSQEKNPIHLCYCHVPTQYYWQMYDKYLENPGFGFLNPLVRFFFKLLVKPLRQADYRVAQQPDQFITISRYAASQIKQYYNREATIIAPPVETSKFQPNPQAFPPKTLKKSTKTANFSTAFPQKQQTFPQGFFIIACRQVPWKRVDLAIQACLDQQVPLLVVGDGSEHSRLVKLARKLQSSSGSAAPGNETDLIKFLPWTGADQLAIYLQNAKAYLFPSLEPFGVAAVEALAAGCPVIAFREGGSRDFIKNRENGLLFDAQTPASLASALKTFESLSFDRAKISASATRFSTTNFDTSIKNLIKKSTERNRS